MSLRRFVLFASVLCLLLIRGTVAPPPAHAAASIVVNSLADTTGECSGTGSGTCTLRDAITYANSIAESHTIHFSVGDIITLTAPLPAISNYPVTIDGAGKIQVDGASQFQVLTVNHLSTLNLTALTIANGACYTVSGGSAGITNYGELNLDRVTFTNNNGVNCSDGGGAIFNAVGSTLNVTGSTFSNNGTSENGGAIYNGGALTVTGSTFKASIGASGGAIANATGATATITDSTFSGNTTGAYDYGGGIYNDSGGTLNVSNSTLSGNWANYGGGIYNNSGTLSVTATTFSGNTGETGGGGIYNDSGTVSLTNSTVSGNTSKPFGNGGGIYNLDGALTVTNSTIYGNNAPGLIHHSGGIYNDGTSVTLHNTIVANNSEYSNYECYDYAQTLTADKYNLDDDGSCGGATETTVTGLALGPLQNNGGPTATFALGANSPALDAGDNTVCAAAPVSAVDQRGAPRPQGTSCDVGAFESTIQSGPAFVVNDSADAGDGLCGALVPNLSNCTLREAIDAANARRGADTITFNIPASTAGCTASNKCTITLTATLPVIKTNLTINGSANNGSITINGANTNLVLTILNTNKTLNLNALNIVIGTCKCDEGGGILNSGALNVTNSTFSVNAANGGAGNAIANYGTTTITNSTFAGNPTQTGSFGGVFNGANGTLHVTNSTISGETYGIYANGGSVTLRNTIVAANLLSDCVNGGGSLTADSHNLDSDGKCDKAVTGTAAQIALGPLKDNDGPTLTMKPGAGSAARNAGDNAVCAAPVGGAAYGAGGLDQRGVTRPQGAVCDIGAFEVRVK